VEAQPDSDSDSGERECGGWVEGQADSDSGEPSGAAEPDAGEELAGNDAANDSPRSRKM
jgi:hypothetical protein